MNYHHKFTAIILAILMASLVGCASTATQEGTGEYIDNTVITTKVKAAIFNEPTLKSFEINVET
ncbi:MAG: transporter, partial [Gammaproteobacteria bacterium]|nr:transporter [Gammaproteobacteria bacterium]